MTNSSRTTNKIINSVAAAMMLTLSFGTLCHAQETVAGWVKYENNPVLGGDFGTIFDISVLRETNGYSMWSSWRPKKSIALSTSKDGLAWTDPIPVLMPNPGNTWESDLNRPCVIKKDNIYHMWYTGQADGKSWIGYATSPDGKTWRRTSKAPVLSAELAWEKTSVMCPSVIWDQKAGIYKMWYSGGEQYEPDAIGYATSADGINWKKNAKDPIFSHDPLNKWEQAKVTACQVIQEKGYYLMFYIGFRDVDYAQIGIARSKDGIHNWERHPQNPIIRPGDGWDSSAVYKPYAIYDGKQWLLWYNGRKDGKEQIGVVLHKGEDLGFDK
ncbi:MAG TPA: hypothetical protein VKB19_07895 [Pedobacter sp.]|nr:hypothetical protein [Pedobacter sp.]